MNPGSCSGAAAGEDLYWSQVASWSGDENGIRFYVEPRRIFAEPGEAGTAMSATDWLYLVVSVVLAFGVGCYCGFRIHNWVIWESLNDLRRKSGLKPVKPSDYVN